MSTLLLMLSAVNSALAGGKDDPLLGKVMIDQLEVRDADEHNLLVLDGQGWFGKDLQKLWFKAEVERKDSETEEAELQALYSQAIAPFWDVQVGVRQDFQPTQVELGLLLVFRASPPTFLKLIQHYLSERVGALRYDWKPSMNFCLPSGSF